jgi:hypothetical protein
MDSKQLEISCPCCSTRLLIDVRTETVLRARRAEETDTTGKPKVDERDWADALGRVQKRTSEAPSKLDEALRNEREKRARLDDLFSKANEKLKRNED